MARVDFITGTLSSLLENHRNDPNSTTDDFFGSVNEAFKDMRSIQCKSAAEWGIIKRSWDLGEIDVYNIVDEGAQGVNIDYRLMPRTDPRPWSERRAEHLRENSRRWYQENKERKREYSREYNRTNRARINAAKRQRRKRNKELNAVLMEYGQISPFLFT